MFIKTIVKTDKGSGKRYEYFRLCEGYRIGGRVRHRTILSLGKLDGIENKADRKLLADRIEVLIKREQVLFVQHVPQVIEDYAKLFSQRIINQGLIDIAETGHNKVDHGKELPVEYENINIHSINHDDVRELGSEWLCKQTLDKLTFSDLLINSLGFSQSQANTAIMHIISRAVYPASEHKTAQWIGGSSTVSELCNISTDKVNRYQLYSSSRQLYNHKGKIEEFLSTKTNELFDLQDKIIFYDLTNTYFEGRKLGSKIAKFGRSKEKRSDAKIVALATVINAEGFIKYSRIYRGNIGDSKTLTKTIEDLSLSTSSTNRKPTIVMDAGIVSEENLQMLKEKGYDYICVSRTKLKDYKAINPEGGTVTIFDKREHPIELKLVKKEGEDDTFLYVHSQQKAIKEASMNDHFSERYEQELENINQAVNKKGGTKKLIKVWERIGRLKERYPTANKHYKIEVIADQDKEKAIEVKWIKNQIMPKSNEGIYFIRTSLDKYKETTLWTIYNTLTEIEATFRVLKTDLSLRPVFHKTDEHSEAHLFLGLLAYQIVATIRHQLKKHKINHDWRNIIRIMNTQKMVTTTMRNKKGNLIRIKKASTPSVNAKRIYEALEYKQQPFIMKKSVVPE